MARQLVVVTGPDKGRVFPLSEAFTLLLGRSRHTETKLTDLRVSRVHCEVEEREGQVWISDLESGGGTFVNGKRIGEDHPLQPGDVIQVGETQLRLMDEEVADQSTLTAGAPAAGPARQLTSERLGELSGTKLSHFEVGPLLARAQTGFVFRAHDFKNERPVALKVLWPEASKNDAEMRRFVRAMKTMLPLRHPNLVTLHGAGKTGPYCWIAMELVEGESLAQVIQQIGTAGMLDWRQSLLVGIQIARALDYAHQQNIIHRNITPQNILIASADRSAKLGDLMLAKALEGTLAQQITRPGQILGDVRYMPPERTGGTTQADGRSDIYSLGATLYALLTGRPPFEGATLIDTLRKIRTEEPIKPKVRHLAIPDLFEGAVLRMLAKRPDERYATAAKLVADLERIARFQGVAE